MKLGDLKKFRLRLGRERFGVTVTVMVTCTCCADESEQHRSSVLATRQLCAYCSGHCFPLIKRLPGEETLPEELVEYRRELITFLQYRETLRKRYS